MGDQVKMYTYIKDKRLYILLPHSGKIFRIREGFDSQYLELILDSILYYQSEVDELIITTQAQSIES